MSAEFLSVELISQDRAMDLSNLPSDVIMRIIRIARESIKSLRLISQQWNSYSIEYLNNRQSRDTFPDIKEYREYFGVDKWKCRPIPSNSDEEYIVEVTWVDPFLSHLISEVLHEYNDISQKIAESYLGSPESILLDFMFFRWRAKPNRKELLLNRISRLLKRCSRIEKLVINMSFAFHIEYDPLKLVMNEVIVGHLHVLGLTTLRTPMASHILKVLRSRPVISLHFDISSCDDALFNTFFAEAFRLTDVFNRDYFWLAQVYWNSKKRIVNNSPDTTIRLEIGHVEPGVLIRFIPIENLFYIYLSYV